MRYNILICDDDDLHCELLEKLLESYTNYSYVSVYTPEDALEAVENQEFDLILMDIILSGTKDGIETVEEIKQHHDIPVIYITGANPEDVFDRAKVTSPYGYLLKPVDRHILRTTIETVLQRFRLEQFIIESDRTLKQLFDASYEAKRYIDNHFIIV